jgi:hypothetical protein
MVDSTILQQDIQRMNQVAEQSWKRFLEIPYLTSLLVTGNVTMIILENMVGGIFKPSHYTIDPTSNEIHPLSVMFTIFFSTSLWHGIVNIGLILIVIGALESKIGTLLTTMTLIMVQLIWWILFLAIGYSLYFTSGYRAISIVGISPAIFGCLLINVFLLEKRDFTMDFAIPVGISWGIYSIVFGNSFIPNLVGCLTGFLLARGVGARIMPKQSRVVEIDGSRIVTTMKKYWIGSFQPATTDWLDGQPSPFNRTNMSPMFHTWTDLGLAINNNNNNHHGITTTTTPVSSKEVKPLLSSATTSTTTTTVKTIQQKGGGGI